MRTTQQFTTTAAHLVQAFDSTAHSAIDAWRAGGERLGAVAAERWDSAFAQARPKLSAETRRNAQHARAVAARTWRQVLATSTGGAEVAVDAIVQAAQQAIGRAQTWQDARSSRA